VPGTVRPEPGTERSDRAAGRGPVVTLAGTVVGALANFVMLAVVGQSYGTAAFAVFGGVTALFLVLTMITRLGADQGVLWAVARLLGRNRPEAVGRVVAVALAPVALASTAVASAVFAGAEPIASLLAGAGAGGDYAAMLRVVAVAIPAAAVGEVLLGATRGFGSMRPTVLSSQLGRQVGQAVCVGLVVLAGGGLSLLAAAWAAPYLCTVLYPAWWLRRRLVRGDAAVEAAQFWRYAGSQAANQAAQIGLEKFDIILLGPLAGLAAQASYNAANRLTHLAVLAWYALMLPHSARWAGAFEHERHDEVNRSARIASAWGILVVAPLLVSYLLFGSVWTSLLSPGLSDGAGAIAVLAGGLLAALLLGPCENLLLMAGRSGWSFLNNLAGLVVDVALNLVLIPRMGAVGAALSWAVALAVVRLAATVQLWRVGRVTSWSRSSALALAAVAGTFGTVGLAVRAVLGGGSRVGLVVSLVVAVPLYLAAAWLWREPLALDVLRSGRVGMPWARTRPGGDRAAGRGPDPVADGFAPAAQAEQAGDDDAGDDDAWDDDADGPAERFVAMVESAHLVFRIRSGAATAMPVSRRRLRLLLDVVPAVGLRGRLLRSSLRLAAPVLALRPQLLPRLSCRDRLDLPFDRRDLAQLLEQASWQLGRPFDEVIWLLPPSNAERRLGVLLLAGGEPVGHLRLVERRRVTTSRPRPHAPSGRRSGVLWPQLLDRWHFGRIDAELSTALPLVAYRPARLSTERLLEVVDDIRDALQPVEAGDLVRQFPAMHGDLTPWNLLESSDGRLVLFDWEHAGFGPPDADLVRYLANSRGGTRRVAELPGSRRQHLARAASYWLRERNRRSFGEPTLWQRRGGRAEIAGLEALGGVAPPEAELVTDHLDSSTDGFVADGPGRNGVVPAPAANRPGAADPPGESADSPGLSVDPRDLSAAGWRWGPPRLVPSVAPYRRLLAGWTLLVAVLAGLVGAVGARTEVLSAKIVLRDPWVADPTVVERPVGGDYERFVRAQGEVVRSRTLLERAAAVIDIDPDALVVSTAVVASDGATALAVEIAGPSEAAVRTRFDAVVTAYRQLRSAAVDGAGDAQLAELAELQRRRPWDGGLIELERELRLARQRYGDGVALAEVDAVRPRVSALGIVVRVVLGAMAALAVGLAVVWGAARHRARHHGTAPFGRGVPLTSIGTVAHLDRLRRTTAEEAAGYEQAAAALLHALADRPPRLGGSARAVVVGGLGTGGVTAAALLAAGARGIGHRAEVLVVDDASRAAGFDALDALAGGDVELLVLAVPAVGDSSLALRFGEVVDAVVLVVPRGRAGRGLRDTVARFRRVDTAVLLGLATRRTR